MLPTGLRIMLVLGALCAFGIVSAQVKKSKILVEDAIFWVVTAAILVIIAAFPQLAIGIANALGFMSASNFVYLVIIALLLWKVFSNSTELSRLKAKVNELAQEIALEQIKQEEREKQD